MAARRIAKSSVNWASLAERVPEAQKTSFINFKSKADKYLRSVMVNPETAPKIDWAYYKSRVAISGMVDQFQSKYDAVKVPYPADNFTAKVVEQEGQVKTEISSFVQASKGRIEKHEKEITYLQGLLPYDQMTMEDYRDSFPEEALDPINNPTFWPHDPEEQGENKPVENHH